MKIQYLELINYVDGMLLTAEQCRIEQRYTTDLSYYLNAALIEAGTVTGLNVRKGGQRTILVEEGLAVDECGREIVQPDGASPVNLPYNTHCHSGTLSVYIRFRILPDPEDEYLRRAVPEILFDGDHADPRLRLAILELNDGRIEQVAQAHVSARLNIPSADHRPPPPSQEVLSGKAIIYGVDYQPGMVVRTAVFFQRDEKPAFEEKPVVEISVETTDGAVFATSFCQLDRRGFTVGISYIAGGNSASCGQNVTIHWTARARVQRDDPGGC